MKIQERMVLKVHQRGNLKRVQQKDDCAKESNGNLKRVEPKDDSAHGSTGNLKRVEQKDDSAKGYHDNDSASSSGLHSTHENSFDVVDGYKVKKEVVPLLKAIFTKYGDIAKDSKFSIESRSCLLELVCSIYKRLEASQFMQLTPLEIQSMLGQIGDLELVKVEVEWIHKRLLCISKARKQCDDISDPMNVRARMLVEMDERRLAIKDYEEELKSSMATVVQLQQKIQQEKDDLRAVTAVFNQINNSCDGSLVHGLI